MTLTTRDRALLGVVVALVAAFGFYKFVLTPQHHKAAALQTKIAAARTTLAKAQQNQAEGRAAEAALRSSQPDWIAAQHAVPAVANVPALLRLLSRSAGAAHVTLQDVSLSGGSGSAASASTTATPGATAVPVSLTFTGGYQALNRLVDRLDSFVTVSKRHLHESGPLIGIGAVTVNPQSSGSKLSVELTASIYQRSAASTAAAGNTEGAG